ncbi:cupin domain-containing protein [Bacillus dakarensis]|uniref:cupin domain-containing protein n=1 Tax=Robertmurraya dakarensis TaxID=1926278 RepID=UPI000981B86E|nr:cupin domain-containing protein [Bacillus dakarensis]
MKKTNLQEYIEYSEERFTKRIVFKEGESTVFVLNFKPQQSLPAHKHPGTNVYLLVVEGAGTFKIDGKEVKASKNDVILADGDEEFAFVNDSNENTSVYVMLNKIPNENYAQNI